ncbi:MAG: glycerol-3-phosphate acyltransferase [Acidimicrobiia bacterium]|nr:glycerol-3-phosphate acyltransferase [Acidimicrobiia bacterium]
MKIGHAIGAATVGYLLGSVSSGRLVGKVAAPGEDVTITTLDLPGGATLDFEGVSATSIAARSGPGWGMLTGTFDMAKAYVPTRIARKRWPDEPYAAIVAASAIAGHNFPVYHGFRGGRGMAPFFGAMLALDPVGLPATQAGGIAVGVGVFGDTWAAYTGGMWLTVPWFAWRRKPAETAFALAANLLFTFASRKELGTYVQKRRSGELAGLRDFKSFAGSYDTMTGASQDASAAQAS